MLKRKLDNNAKIDISRAFMDELGQKNMITAKSKWKEIYPIVHDDERYQKMLGQPGNR